VRQHSILKDLLLVHDPIVSSRQKSKRFAQNLCQFVVFSSRQQTIPFISRSIYTWFHDQTIRLPKAPAIRFQTRYLM